VYNDGDWADYDPKFFRPYAELFRTTTFWPTLGNHVTSTENGAPYFDAFYLPTASGAPGVPSGTEHYYSFDHGMAHFVCLDSEATSSTPGGAMHAWADADLAHARARGKRWLVVFLHHPPYSRGTHDSTSESELIRLHDNLVPLFESHDVDLVLSGHSHVYERSFLARDDAILQADVAEYTKVGSPDGTVYMVTGCGGKSGSGPLDHPLMARSYGSVLGFNVMDVSWEELRGRFIEDDGRTTDLFTLRKAADVRPPRVTAVEVRAADEVALVFAEPVQAGTGAAGAENAASYVLDAPAAVLAATLDSDRSTVVLETTVLPANRVLGMHVMRVADPGGRAVDQRVLVAHASGASTGGGSAVVPRGSEWRYRDGLTAPPASWNARGFDDSAWSRGPAGFGYSDGDDATVLADMRYSYATVYVRTPFTVADPTLVSTLVLQVDYDDGFVAYLNGTELARAGVPAGQTNTTLASSSHEAGTVEVFDVGALRGLLVAGTNVLALEGHNYTLDSGDFSLHPELLLGTSGGGGGGPPTAVLHAPVRTANAPARLAFSAARSRPGAAPIVARGWDFGDGSGPAAGAEVEHVYTQPGLFTVGLIVRDEAGLESLAAVQVRIHEQGSAPRATLVADATQIAPGASVAFDARGSLDPDGGPVTVHWDFGDPASGTANHSNALAPSHTYARDGTHVVTLVVTDDEGSGAAARASIVVGSGTVDPPTAAFSAHASPADPLRVQFTDLSGGEVDAWSWQLGDGTTADVAAPEHLYAAAGVYTVRLTVTGPGGSDTVEQPVEVGSLGPLPDDDSGGGGGGACSLAPGGGPRSGDPLLALVLLLALGGLLRRGESGRRRGLQRV
jgi:PKD repeat protein